MLRLHRLGGSSSSASDSSHHTEGTAAIEQTRNDRTEDSSNSRTDQPPNSAARGSFPGDPPSHRPLSHRPARRRPLSPEPSGPIDDDLDNPLDQLPVGPLDDPAPDMNLDNDDEMEEGEIRENDEQDEDRTAREDDGHDQLMPSAPGLTSFSELKLEREKMLRTDGGGFPRIRATPMRIHRANRAEHAERIRRAMIATDAANPYKISRLSGY